jgi:DNA-binding NarL/FixJ family response regulator
MKKILIFEDNMKYLASLRLVLDDADDIAIVASYPNTINISDKIRKNQPDLILMDIEMPGLDGIQSVALLRKEFSDVKVIMLTILKESAQIMAAIQAGANGYLVKSWPAEDILEEIRHICATNEPVLSPEIAQNLFKMAKQPSDEKFTPKHFDLSKQEKLVLHHLVQGKTYQEIAAALFLSQHTINSHLKSVYKKLEVHSSFEAVRIATQYKLVDQ